VNRAARRAFAKNIAKAMGRAKAHRPPEESPTAEERLAQLEARNAEIERRLAGLEERHDQVPGVVPGRRDWSVVVGGEVVPIRALPPQEWLATTGELPEFLFSLAVGRDRPESQPLTAEERAQKIHDVARRWIAACAVDPEAVDLDHLTVLEAEHAVAHIAELNGVTAYLAKWFRSRLHGVAAPAPDRENVRAAPQRPAGGQPN